MDATENELIQKLNKPSPEMREIIFWMTDNIDFVSRICRGKAMPKENWEKYMELAIIKGDNLGIALLVFKHMKDKAVSIWNFNNNKKKVGEIRNEEFERGTLPGKHTGSTDFCVRWS